MPSILLQRARAVATADTELEAEVEERDKDVDLLAPAETILALIIRAAEVLQVEKEARAQICPR
jgi:hypothetical protein